MYPHPFVHMVEIAQAAGLPRRFATDLFTHDLAWMNAHPRVPFGWILYEDGTHIAERGISRPLADAMTEPDWSGARFYICGDGRSLHEVSRVAWVAWVTRSPLRGIAYLEEAAA